MRVVLETNKRLLNDKLHHVLWINDAHNLSRLLELEDGKIALKKILGVLVGWKMKGLATVVLTSSKSFDLDDGLRNAVGTQQDPFCFRLVLRNAHNIRACIGRDNHRIQPFCMGCFNEADARAYYTQLTANVGDLHRALLPTFEQAYEVVGGHPAHIHELVEQCLTEGLLERGLVHHDACVQSSYVLHRAMEWTKHTPGYVSWSLNDFFPLLYAWSIDLTSRFAARCARLSNCSRCCA